MTKFCLQAIVLLLVSVAICRGTVQGHNCDSCVIGHYPPTDHCKEHCDKAKKEAQVDVYSVFSFESLRRVIEAYEAAVPFKVKINIIRNPASNLVSEILAMAKQGQQKADLVITTDTTMGLLLRSNLLVSSPSPSEEDFFDAFKDSEGRWVAPLINLATIAYNTRLVSKADAPKTWKDLLDPRLKGRVGLPNAPGFFAAFYGIEGQGFNYLKMLRRNMPVEQGISATTKLAATGEIPISLTYAATAIEFVQKGAPLGLSIPQPTPVRFYPCGIVNGASHPNAALTFFEFLISPRGQEVLGTGNLIPANVQKIKSELVRNVVSNPKSLRSIEPQRTDLIEKYGSELKTIFR